MIDIKQALKKAILRLKPISTSAEIDADILLAFTLATSRTFLYAHPEKILSDIELETYEHLIEKRCAGVPIAHLTGTREFWSLPLKIGKDTLIPRPETELLVELCLNLLKDKPSASILDLGTGSGAIALALASERPDWKILACDLSPAALDIAEHNAQHLSLRNIKLLRSDWFSSIGTEHFDAIISNPPYIAKDDPHLNEGDLRFEPLLALVSGVDGLDSLRYIIEESCNHLLPGGLLLLEHGFSQKQAVMSLMLQGGYQNLKCWTDFQGHDRISGGWMPSK